MKIEEKDKKLVIVAVIICIAIACLSPFLASSNPDGLEKTVEDANVSEGTDSPVINSPLNDYSLESLGKMGEIAALVIGIVILLLIFVIIIKIL